MFITSSLSRRLSCRAMIIGGLALPLQHARAQASPADSSAVSDAATAILPTVEVHGASPAPLDRPLGTGSLLGLTAAETPASVESISKAQLVDRGDARLMDAFSRAAGISILPHPGNGGSALSARGFTDTASVTQLYDGVKLYGTGAVTFPFDTWSVQSVEVLRGPASVIYGEGAIGGVVNVIPKKPTRTPIENEVQLGVGTENTQRLGLGSGGAINDQLSYRVDASANRSDNWVDAGASRDATFSGALRLDATPDLYFILSHAQSEQKPMRYFGTPLINGTLDPATYDKNYNVADGLITYRDTWSSAALHWTPRQGVSVNSTVYHMKSARHWQNVETYTWQPASGQILRSDYTEILHHQKQVGNATNATFEGQLFGLRNSFAAGFELNHTTFQHTNNSGYLGSSLVDPYDVSPGQFVNIAGTRPKYRVKAQQYALFAEDHLKLTDRLALLAGLRYDHDQVRRQDLVTGTNSFDTSFHNVGYRVGAVYDLSPGLALYGQYSVASDPLGALLFTNTSRAAFKLAKGKQIEIGLKQSFWEQRGDWTLAAYRIVKNDLLTADPDQAGSSIQVGQQSSRGLEAAFSVAPTRNWKFDGNATLLRASYDDFSESDGASSVSRNGNTPPDVPRRMANLWANWLFAADWTAIAGVHHVGARYADNANTLDMPAYTTSDLALRWQWRKDTNVTLRGSNIFDKRYAATAYYNGTQWLLGADRRVELSLYHSF